MDGSAATAAIRKIEESRPEVPPAYIVALTGLATDLDKKLAFEAGMDRFLTKPVSLKELLGAIHDWKRRGYTGSKKDQ
jgi:CheY-like chemotaxis protein